MKNRNIIISMLMFLAVTMVQAQISIGGNVYGGGNAGPTGGSTTVTVRAGDIDGSVYGGARQANVGGSAFVHIDGEHMSGDILINYVYGGNDIAGTIGASTTIPNELTEAVANGITNHTGDNEGKNKQNKNNYNAFVLTTKERTVTTGEGNSATTTQPYKMYIGQLFGGGNGDYTYSDKKTNGKYDVTIGTTTTEDVDKPDIGKTYIEMRGGSCVILYGGGNNVTVTGAADICIDNPSEITTEILDGNGNNKLEDNDRLKRMGCYALGGAAGATGYVTSDDYQFSRVFGGNNKAPMAIRPKWHLKQGKIRNLYSGGNAGDMTYENGIFLSIKEEANPDPDTGYMGLIVGNVYGGCRMADVNPDKNPIGREEIEGVVCPAGYAARLNIAGGTIGNVYGGNDISGTVYGGNAVGIHSSINGDVYGGGNGSYPYTDNDKFEHKDGKADTEAVSLYGDYFYDVKKALNLGKNATFTGLQSAQVLNEKIRPHAEKVTVRLISDNPNKPTIIGGSVYCGGNSATLRSSSGSATAELKIGSYVYANNVFLGSNGENMVTEDMLKQLAGDVMEYDFSQIDLTVPAQMKEYMKGCEMDVRPSVVFDAPSDGTEGHTGYVAHSTYFGSLYCGGNVGSVNVPGMNTINFSQNFVIFDKLVGGCNNAYVPVKYDGTTALNAAFDGGLIADPDETTKNKLTLNLSNVKIQPMRWKDESNKALGLEWNTFIGDTENDATAEYTGEATTDDLNRRFKGGNVYGGCCESGHINGNVIINIDHTLMDPKELFDEIQENDNSLYGQDILTKDSYHITKRRSGVILGQQGMDVLGTALNIYGGGKGKSTEIWGSTTINHNGGYVFQIFGGSEEGVIGKGMTYEGTQKDDKTYENGNYYFNGKKYTYNADYSCTVNLKGAYDGVPKSTTANVDLSDCEFIYGGGFLGPICGNTIVNLGKGRIFNSFTGSCNADILGHTETYMGRQINSDGTSGEGFPYVRDYIYGGNDMGGRILGTADFSDRVRNEVKSMIHGADAPKNVSSYVEYVQGRAIGIFGGCYGTYDYTDPEYKDFFYTTGATDATETNLGTARSGYTKPRMDKAFVNFRPTFTDDLKNKTTNTISEIYGAGQGYPGDADRDIMQKSSYILIDIPQTMENYKNMEVWGAGAWSGLGMETYVKPNTTDAATLNAVSAIIDLPRGQIAAAYGGSYQEGVTRRTVVNVPTGSTLQVGSIFGGAYGTNTYMPCDVYEANVNWNSEDAVLIYNPKRTDEETKKEVGDDRMKGAIYGGNNNKRRTLYGKVNIYKPMKQNHWKYGMSLGTVYGAGCGGDTWAEYTEVNLEDGAQVYEVYGGGQAGKVHNAESVQYYMNLDKPDYTWPEGYARAGEDLTEAEWKAAWRLGGGYDPPTGTDPNTNKPYTYWENTNTNLANPLARTAEMDDRDFSDLSSEDLALVQNKYSTNVIIKRGATVENYAYGGGLGEEAVVAGTTYITLLGGTVKKDIYAAGTSGAVQDLHGAEEYSSGNRAGFMASANVYIAGGTVRNVYGGGWKGSVGRHMKDDGTGKMVEADIHESAVNDIPGETHVVIGIRKDQTNANLLSAIRKVAGSTADASAYGFYCGVPAIQRNAYGGGEGGAVYGTANLTINNGYIGYDYKETTDEETGVTTGVFEEKINDETYYENEKYAGDNRLRDCGNVFGGGYDARSSVDESNIKIWGGMIRGSLHGGGEIATIGRGSTKESGDVNYIREFNEIYKAGKTHIEMYNGHVKRNVFGGGKGYNLLGYGSNSDLYTDGYTFGQTEVYIHGGEIGTEEGLAEGYGNVFGGGDLGYVYSKGYSNDKSHKTETGSPDHYYYYYDDGTGDKLIEDCKVVVAPYLQLKANADEFTFDGKSYGPYDYVPTDYLNTLTGDKSEWTHLYTGDGRDTPGSDDTVERGVIIRNAVFGGGNVSSNSDTHYANATTVFGNTTATLYDVYHRDFITVGTEHTGGLYGGGNLSVVNGYRELNITNYGTDYYGLNSQITLEQYKKLSNRERAYFELQYVCKNGTEAGTGENVGKTGITIGGVFYENGKPIKESEYLKLIDNNPGFDFETYWEPYGFCSIYAGRLLNTIQRADFCGVYGSRMVLQGAKDRVADVAEKIDYTINRVGELSLNKQVSVINGDPDEEHGNYFGIYSIVNYLGNLTSDVTFGDNRQTATSNNVITTTEDTYYNWKKNQSNKERNKGYSPNQVALASGVYLELTTEHSTGTSVNEKEWGYITGIIELDLINVKREMVGGGYVYAKNEHRVPKYYPEKENVILSEYNKASGTIRDEARTHKRYRFATSSLNNFEGDSRWDDSNWPGESSAYVISGDNDNVYKLMSYETSGNFIHRSKRIVDDCYPTTNAFKPAEDPYSLAHYWYVKGDVYIYEQIVSAYTGSATAYSKEVHLPLTITAASHGKLKLINVQPNLYAYYSDYQQTTKMGDEGVTVNNESETYHLNDVISYWDWNLLSPIEQRYFVKDTYVNAISCTIDGTLYSIGEYVMDENSYTSFSKTFSYINDSGDEVTVTSSNENYSAEKADIFRSSNNISHDTGYVLTFDMNSPPDWDDWYSVVSGDGSKISKATWESYATDDNDATNQSSYIEGPTFRPSISGVYGQTEHNIGDIITEEVYNNYPTEDQDKVKPAYVAKETVTYNDGTKSKTINEGTAISGTEYNYLAASGQTDKQNSFAPAKVCTTTLKLAEKKYMLYGDLLSDELIASLKQTYAYDEESGTYTSLADEIDNATTPAYMCVVKDTYGGQNYFNNTNYSATASWCSLSAADRENFSFNYDALDLLIDKDYSANTSLYHSPYCDTKAVEYDAKFIGDEDHTSISYTYNGTSYSFNASSDAISRAEFESNVPNEKRYYVRVSVAANGETKYIANDNFIYGDNPIGKGQVVDEEIYTASRAEGSLCYGLVDAVKFKNTGSEDIVTYYCYEGYTDMSGNSVAAGITKTPTDYANLPNYQQYFTIQGQQPTETTTLYVTKESDIKDVTKEKIITVVYQYTYNEEDESGAGIQTTNELHVVNIHLQLESGAPQIGLLTPPPTVLPGDGVGMKPPTVNPGLYEVLTNGWELFDNYNDASVHRNGVEFKNNSDPVYWYQNGDHYIAFYSKTYLGKTYSNPVPLSVANYHDLADIMENHKDNHLYIDRADVDRPCKVYINDYSLLDSDDPRKDKNGLDELKDLFNLSTGAVLDGHTALGSHIRGCDNLEIIMRTDVDHSDSPWTSIAAGTNDTDPCFGGNLHGDGHTISGLSQSLFGKLCGNVYNLGVTGSFTSAGVADTGDGFVENCWIKTTATTAAATKPFAVFGNPSDGTGTQLVNCYYPKSNEGLYNTGTCARGTARMMPDRAFYNGEVAYDLNGFYLGKRYYDGIYQATGKSYDYLPAKIDGTLPTTASTGHYPAEFAIYPLAGTVKEGDATAILGYVESRFYDGDFRYADGTIPETFNIRRQESEPDATGNTTVTWAAIWPDDYLFFGQRLNYGHVEGQAHQEQPSVIYKLNDRLVTTAAGNRVFRAPAYFRSSTMQVAHFNPYAVFAQTKKGDATTVAYKNMTAIDFTGGKGDVDDGYKKGLQGDKFYPPLLDDGGLTAFQNIDLTKNLLAYTYAKSDDPATTAAEQTANVVSSMLHDYAYAEGNATTYRTVAPWDRASNWENMHGHWVQLTDEGYMAPYDHYLVDKQDFNAPMGYQFASGKRMWYQRKPDLYAGQKKDNEGNLVYDSGAGWEGVSLPFTAEIVTTQTKGELTHFYKDSDGSSRKGHEYWLREFTGNVTQKKDDEGNDVTGVYTADFDLPAAGSGDKEVTNTFLWDYYYYYTAKADHHQLDENTDTYQTYYNSSRTYNNYARLQSDKPYIIGFPGQYYYEFDLSGTFDPITTYWTTSADRPAKLDPQTITFASATEALIGVSDAATGVTYNGYTFKPNYLSTEVPADGGYMLSADGDSYEMVKAATVAVPFRPYFVYSSGNGAKKRVAEKIVFGMLEIAMDDEDENNPMDDNEGRLIIGGKKQTIIVTSSLSKAMPVRIVNLSGLAIATFNIQPGESIETPVPTAGVYIVQAANGKYRRKISVK